MLNFDIGGFIGATFVVTLVMFLLTTGIIVGVIVWAIRRTLPTGKDAAMTELRDRLARGEIDPAEFQARFDALSREK